MKNALSILMITALTLPGLTKIGILVDFKINQDVIAEVLCVNREKPASKCHGTCYLSEQLKKVEEQEEKQAPASKKERLEVVYYYLYTSPDFLPLVYAYVGKLKPTYEHDFFTSSFIADIFRPPKLNLI